MAEKADHSAQPLIIKRINKIVGGHHGGAWKVAYADFVTAMMAFFLLLWLLATTTPEQREGIAEYFTPTVGLKDSKGIGFEGGLTPNEKGTSRTTLAQPGLVAGQVPQGPRPKPPEDTEARTDDAESSAGAIVMPEGAKSERTQDDAAAKAKEQQAKDEREAEAMKKIQEQIMKAMEESSELQQLRKNIIISNTPEGLKIDVIDDPENPLFLAGTATMTDIGRKMFSSISNVITKNRNLLSIAGHTESVAFPPGATYTSWELSADRANATRRFITESLHDPHRVSKVQGMADRDLLLPKEPQNPRNRRMTLTLLRGTQMVDPKDAPAARDLLSVPDVDAKKIVKKKAEPPPKPKQPIEVPETDPNSIFSQKEKKPGEAKPGEADGKTPAAESSSGNGPEFTVPKEVPNIPPPPPKPKAAPKPKPVEQPQTLSEPVTLPETNPDSLFTPDQGAKGSKKGFQVPE